jgi:hypothetical protein
MMSGPMMQGMMQSMQGMMHMMHRQAQRGAMPAERMPRGPMRSPQSEGGMMMNCPMMQGASDGTTRGMMQMMQGMMQMMQTMHGQMQDNPMHR